MSEYIPGILLNAVLFVLPLLILLLFFTRKDDRIYKCFQAFPGPTPYPVVGCALSFIVPRDELWTVLLAFTEKYGTRFAAWLGNLPYVFLGNPSDVEKILSSTIHINKAKDYDIFVTPWLGDGLLTAKREKWQVRRKMLTPTFHFKILEDFIPIFNEQSKILCALLEKQRQIEDSFDICPFISKCALDIICETAMGEKINAQIGGESTYVKTVSAITYVLVEKGLNPAYRQPFIWNLTNLKKLETEYLNRLHGFTEKIIRARKAERKRKLLAAEAGSITQSAPEENADGTKTRKAFLDLLLDLQDANEETMIDADIREEVDTFMFEGHDTTGANLDWTIFTLACYPECQKVVHEELDGIFGKDMERPVTFNDIKQLKYMECCIKETLRIYPSVPFIIRSVDEDIALDEKRIIPKGCSVFISIYSVHRDPESYPDPEKFDPDRFTNDNAAGRHPYAYIPFSAGPRNCIGQKFALYEEKIILATLLRKFRLEAVDTRETVMPLMDAILRPRDGIRVRLIKRV